MQSNVAVSGKSEDKNIPRASDGKVLDTYLRETHMFTRKHITYFTAALFIITKNSKLLKCASRKSIVIVNELVFKMSNLEKH